MTNVNYSQFIKDGRGVEDLALQWRGAAAAYSEEGILPVNSSQDLITGTSATLKQDSI